MQEGAQAVAPMIDRTGIAVAGSMTPEKSA
jgi:hypothetical protein